jgi:hypothetical protein
MQVNCIVVFDDEEGVCFPMTADPDCDGALCCGTGPVVVFPDRPAAQRAIRISRACYRLMVEQGQEADYNWSHECRTCIKIRPVVMQQETEG